MQKARRHCKSSSDRLQAHGFRDYFTPLLGVLFTFPSRYLFTIGHSVVLSLGEWSPHFQTEFLVLRPTQELNCFLPILDYHHLRSAFPRCSSSYNQIHRLVRFRSPLLSESRLISFPTGTQMFQFPAFASQHYVFMLRYRLLCGFPHSDIHGSMLIHNSP